MDFRQEFIEFALQQNVLRFGEFKTKAGRLSPYFFNAGLFNTGAALDRLSQFYAKAILAGGTQIDMLFGPAYKGIPLVAVSALALARAGRDLPFAYNRKEEKDRQRAINDYLINLKSEVEIRHMHEKVDLLISEQMKTLFDIQKEQVNIMDEIKNAIKKKFSTDRQNGCSLNKPI